MPRPSSDRFEGQAQDVPRPGTIKMTNEKEYRKQVTDR